MIKNNIFFASVLYKLCSLWNRDMKKFQHIGSPLTKPLKFLLLLAKNASLPLAISTIIATAFLGQDPSISAGEVVSSSLVANLIIGLGVLSVAKGFMDTVNEIDHSPEHFTQDRPINPSTASSLEMKDPKKSRERSPPKQRTQPTHHQNKKP